MNEELRAALREQAEARQAYNGLAEDATEQRQTEARERLTAADQAVIEALDASAA